MVLLGMDLPSTASIRDRSLRRIGKLCQNDVWKSTDLLRSDWIKFQVTNDLTDEGTTLHAHGLLQKETSWYDGVPAVAQCPITPNGGYYEMLFRADRYGTSWYHSKALIYLHL